jgi:hypothetical protein
MKKSQEILLKLANKLQRKYAAQSLQEIIQNAASYGEKSANGIMNFPAMLKQDQAELGINVNISGEKVDVSSPTVDPVQVAGKYAALPDQIKKYLERHIRDFPLPQGLTTLQYSGRNAGSRIAESPNW